MDESEHEVSAELPVAGASSSAMAADIPAETTETPLQGYLMESPHPATGVFLENMEPSLDLYWSSPNELAPEADVFLPPAEDIDFRSSHNSPEMAGTSTYYLNRWEAHDSEPQSPRSERSGHSSMYPGGSNRTSLAGGLESRSLIRSSEARAGLETGDVVMLLHQDRPYIAVQAQLPYKSDAWHTCLEPTEEGITPESEGVAYLEVIKQGKYVGFRSGAAGNRFVQPRRKPPHRLVFFNPNCGVWEQWEVLGEAWQADPWSQLPLVFRSRRLPQVELAVDVVRVGYFSTPGGGGPGGLGGGLGALPFAPTPRSLPLPAIPEESRVEDTNLTRMSNVLVLEWFKFVDHEKLVREGVELDVTALKEDVMDLKMNVIRQVEFLRLQMNEEMSSLSEHVALRDRALAALHRWRRRTQQLTADRMARARLRRVLVAWRCLVDEMLYRKAAVLRLSSRRQRALRDRVFWAWLLGTRAATGQGVKLRFALQRRCHALMSRTLLGWQRVVIHKAWRGRTIMAVVQRRSARRLAGVFAGWRLEAVTRGAGRAAMQRALQGVARTGLAAALTAWREVAQAAQRKTVQAELMVSRRAARMLAAALAAWRDAAYLRRFLARHARTALLRRAVTAWKVERSAAAARQRAAAALADAVVSNQSRAVLRGWRDAAANRASVRSRLEGHVLRRSSGLQGRVLGAWARVTKERRRRRVALQRHDAAARLRLAMVVLAAWRALAARRVWHHTRLLMASDRRAKRRMSAVLLAWHARAAAHRATLGRGDMAAARIRRLRLSTCLTRWRQLAARMRLARQRLGALCKRLLGCTLSSTFREWRLLTRTAVAGRSAAARALPSSTRDLLSRMLGLWWARHSSPQTVSAAGAAANPAAARDTEPGSRRRTAASVASVGPAESWAAGACGTLAVYALPPSHCSQQPAQPQVDQQPQVHQLLLSSRHVPMLSGQQEQLQPQLEAATGAIGVAGTSPSSRLPAASVSAPVGASSPATLASGAFATGSPQPQWAVAATRAASPPVARGSAVSMSSPARPPLPTTVAGSPQQQGQAIARSAGPSGGLIASPGEEAAAQSTSPSPSSANSTPVRASSRSYREALVTGGSPAGSAAGGSPGSAASSRSASANRLRSSVSAGGAVPVATAAAAAPALSASTPSSNVAARSSPGRGGEPAGATPVMGLRELLLDGERSQTQPLPLPTGEGLLQTAVEPIANLDAAQLEGAGRRVTNDSPTGASTSIGFQRSAGFVGFVSSAQSPGAGEAALPSHASWPAAAAPSASHVLLSSRMLRSTGAAAVSAYGFHTGIVTGGGLGRWLAATVLSHWLKLLTARRQWVCALGAVAAKRRWQLAGEVLDGWRKVVSAAQGRVAAAEAMAGRVIAKGQRRDLREVLTCWHTAARQRVAVRGLLFRYTARVSAAKTTRVVAEWREVARASVVTKRKVERLVSRHQTALLERTFLAWRDETVDGAARRAAASQLATCHRRDLMSTALAGWSGAAAERRARTARQARAARLAERRRLAGAFRMWRWAADAATERQDVAERASRSAALRAAFGGWRQMAGGPGASSPVDKDVVLQRAAAWHSRRLLRGCLAALREHSGQQQQVYRDAAARSDVRVVGAAWTAWRSEAARRCQAGIQVVKMRARTAQRLLGCVFAAWLGRVDLLREAHRAAAEMGARQDRSVLHGLLNGWWEVTRGSAQKHQRRSTLLLVAGRRLEGVLLGHVLAHWSALTDQMAILRAEADRRLVARSLALLSLSLAGWQDLVQRLRASRHQALTRGSVRDRALLRDALTHWVSEVEAARTRAEAAEAMAARRSSAAVVLSAVLRAWAGVSGCDAGLRRLRRSMLAHLILRRCLAQRRRAFQAWRGVVSERHAREDELRRCIKRKKLAFSLFKQWYWETFDADVHVAIKRMFHSTDPAAHSPVPSLRYRPVAYDTAAADAAASHNGQRGKHPYVADLQQQHLYGAAAAGAAAGSRRTTASSCALPYGAAAGRSADYAAVMDPAAGSYRYRPLTGAPSDQQRLTQSHPHLQLHPSQPQPHPSHNPARASTSASSGFAAPSHQPTSRMAQPQQPPQQARGSARDRERAVEPVRSLASAFDHMAGVGSKGAAARATTAAQQPPGSRNAPGAGAGGAPAAAAGPPRGASAAGRPVSMYSLWRPSDSDESENGSEEGVSGKGQARAGVPRAVAGPALAGWGAGAGRKKEIAFGRTVAAPSAKPTASSAAAAAGSRKPAAAGGVWSSAGGGGAQQRIAVGNPGSGAASLEAVTAMNAVLVNVANQLTEVSRASLEIAAGVVAGGGGCGPGVPGLGVPGGRPYRGTGSIGSGSGPYGYPARVSLDGSYGSSAATGTGGGLTAAVQRGVGSPSAPQPLEGAIATGGTAGSLSPLSPAVAGALAPYVNQVYGNGGASGGGQVSGIKLPGVVPSWRQVATNQLYDEDFYGSPYNDDLGPVEPVYMGITGGAAAVYGTSHGGDTDDDGDGVADEGPGSGDGSDDGSYGGAEHGSDEGVSAAADGDGEGCSADEEATLADMHRATGANPSSSQGSASGAGGSSGSAGEARAAGSGRPSARQQAAVAKAKAKAAAFVMAHGGGGAGAGRRGSRSGSVSGASQAASESSSCCFPQHSTYRNAVFRREGEEGEEEE